MRVETVGPNGEATLYLGDCREVLPMLSGVDAVVTDPIWPGNSVPEYAGIDAGALFGQMWRMCRNHHRPKRLVVHLGTDTDPAMLGWVTLPFFRQAALEYARCGHKGRLLHTGDVAYMYGAPPRSVPGKHLIAGRCIATEVAQNKYAHPTPRHPQHVQWYVYQFTEPEDVICDPFMGSGTTGEACAHVGRRFIGIEIEPKYYEIALKRVSEAYSQRRLFDEPAKPEPMPQLFPELTR